MHKAEEELLNNPALMEAAEKLQKFTEREDVQQRTKYTSLAQIAERKSDIDFQLLVADSLILLLKRNQRYEKIFYAMHILVLATFILAVLLVSLVTFGLMFP